MERIESPHAPSDSLSCPACGAAGAGARCPDCGAARTAGGLRTLRLLHKSEHGRMYEAVDADGRRVALKELAFALVPTAKHLEAFEREARLLSQLSHPRVPRFLKSFAEGTGAGMRLYLAQAFVDGESLAARVSRGPLPADEALEIGRRVLEVLEYLHGLSPAVLHRDVKPANLIRSPEGEIFLVDFGVARELSSDRTHNATLVGTFGYMAPEQLGGTVDARSDLYALGATLVHLVSGKAPESLYGDGMQLDLDQAGLSGRVRRFVEKLLAFKPGRRYASARAALAALTPRASARRQWLVLGVGLALIAAAAAIGTRVLGPDPLPHPLPHPVVEDPDAYHRPIGTEPKQR